MLETYHHVEQASEGMRGAMCESDARIHNHNMTLYH